MLFRPVLTVVLGLTLLGCSTVRPQVVFQPKPPASLLTKCPSNLSYLTGQTISQDEAWRVVLTEWTTDYFQCAIRHNLLVDWEKQIEAIKNEN